MRRFDFIGELLALPRLLHLADFVRRAFTASNLAFCLRLVRFYTADSGVGSIQVGGRRFQSLDVPVGRIYIGGFYSHLLPVSLRLVTATNISTQCNQRLTMRCSERLRVSRRVLSASGAAHTFGRLSFVTPLGTRRATLRRR